MAQIKYIELELGESLEIRGRWFKPTIRVGADLEPNEDVYAAKEQLSKVIRGMLGEEMERYQNRFKPPSGETGEDKMTDKQLVLFSYQELDTETTRFVQERAATIKQRIKRSAQDAIDIGLALLGIIPYRILILKDALV